MGQITSLFARKVVAEVDESLDREALLRSIGIEPGAPVDPSHMVPDSEYYALLERIARRDPGALTLPLRVGASMRCDEYAALGLAWKSAPDLRGSYERAERYARVLTSVTSYELEASDRGAFLHLHRSGERRLGLRLSNEASLASIVSISRQASAGEIDPIEVHLKHPAPESIAEHEAYFRCPVYFASDRDALHLSRRCLETPNKLGDETISRFFDTQLEAELAKLADERSLAQRVRLRVSRSLSEGVPTITDVAHSLNMSGRTLQRRLADRGASFQSLVDESRRQLAEKLLTETDYSLVEVAFMTGFAEQSSFTRAFKRWQGQTPRSYRLAAGPG